MEPEETDVNLIRVFAVKTEDENQTIDDWMRKYSSLLKIRRVLAWCKRFVTNVRSKMGVYKPTVGELTAEEMLASLTFCIKGTQNLAFAEEIYAIKENLELPLKSNLRTYSPFPLFRTK